MAACLLGCVWLLLSARRASLAEPALIAAAMSALAGLSVLQSLAAAGSAKPGPALAFSAAAAALPASTLALAPLVLSGWAPGRILGRHWKGWSTLTLVALAGAGALAWLATPAWLPAGGTVSAGVLAAFGAIGVSAVTARLLRLQRDTKDRRFAVVAVAVAAIAVVRVASGYASAGSAAWWAGWGLELVGFAGVVAAGISLTRHRARSATVLGVPLSHDPLSALEVCASRKVEALVDALCMQEPYAHDHALRLGALATKVAERARLPGRQIRDAGIAGILHDVDPVVAANAVASSKAPPPTGPSVRADNAAADLGDSPALAGVAEIVRYKRVRFDAGGTAGTGAEIRPAGHLPFEASLVAACDAWDAMTHDRSYRDGIGSERARRALLDGSGSLWHPEAVRLVLEETAASRATRSLKATRTLGHGPSGHAGHLGHLVDVAPAGALRDFYDDPCDTEPHPRLDQLSELLRSQKRFRTAFEQAPIGMLFVDPEGRIHSCNSAFETLVGYEDPVVGTTAIDLVCSADRASALRWVASLRRRPDYVYACDLRLKHATSASIPVHVAGSVIEEDDRSRFYLIHVVDLSERRRMESELRRQAFIDPLTGLLNRRGLLSAGPELIRRNQNQTQVTTGVFIDLDGLKAINDTFGHESGDQAIVDVATVIVSAFPSGSLFARLGGDEMYVLTSLSTPDPDTLNAALRSRLADHAASNGRPYSLSASAGTSTYRGGTDTIANLIDRSDRDLYAHRRVERDLAKRRSRSGSDGEAPLREPAMSGPETTR